MTWLIPWLLRKGLAAAPWLYFLLAMYRMGRKVDRFLVRLGMGAYHWTR
jgi:hypothetical protein